MARKTVTSWQVKNKYNLKTYDRAVLFVPKGMGEVIKAHCKERGTSVNRYLNDLIRQEMGIPEEEWTKKEG